MRKHRLTRVIRIGMAAVAGTTIVGLAVMGLWNALMPPIFAVKTISFWQAVGLFLLSRFFFGSFRPFGGGPGFRRGMVGRWANMTPEERERFREGMRRGCERPDSAEAKAM